MHKGKDKRSIKSELKSKLKSQHESKSQPKPQTSIFSISSKYNLKTIFSYMSKNRQYHICLRSKRLQSLMNISLTTYQIISFLSTKHLDLSFIQLYVTIKLKIPSASTSEIIQCLWDKYSEESKPIIITQINHPSIASLIAQINLCNRLNNDIQLRIINNTNFSDNYNNHSILKHITTFKYCFDSLLSTRSSLKFFVPNLKQLDGAKLTGLDISGLNCNEGGVNKEEFIQALSTFSALKKLAMRDNFLKSDWLKYIICALTTLNPNHLCQFTHINFSSNMLTNDCIEDIEKLLIRTHTSLLHLDLSNNYLSCKSIKVISLYTNQLTYFNISNNPIFNEGLIHLLSQSKTSLASILQLDISYLMIDSFALSNNIETTFGQLQYTPITHLYFNTNNMKGISFDTLMNQLKPISTLQCLQLSSFIFESLSSSLDSLSSNHLKELSLTSCIQIDNVLSHSYAITGLTHIDLSLNTFSSNYPSLDFLKHNTQLQVLNVSNCNIHMEAMSPIWNCFNHMEELHLSHNCFTTKSVIVLANALQSVEFNSQLRVFNVGTNAIDKSEMKLLLLSLKHCKRLTRLNVSNIQFDYDNFVLFNKLCKELIHLNEMILFNTGINDNQLKDMMENREFIVRLKVLNLSKNSINNNGINELLRKRELFVGLERLYLMQIVISSQMKEELIRHFGSIARLK